MKECVLCGDECLILVGVVDGIGATAVYLIYLYKNSLILVFSHW